MRVYRLTYRPNSGGTCRMDTTIWGAVLVLAAHDHYKIVTKTDPPYLSEWNAVVGEVEQPRRPDTNPGIMIPSTVHGRPAFCWLSCRVYNEHMGTVAKRYSPQSIMFPARRGLVLLGQPEPVIAWRMEDQ